MKTHEKYATLCVHESAHAVAMLHYDLGLDHVAVRRTGWFGTGFEGNARCGLLGFTDEEILEDPDSFYQVNPVGHVVSSLVAQPAQQRAIMDLGYGRWRASVHASSSCKDDRGKAQYVARFSSWGLSKCRREAERFVDYYWDTIDTVAEALMDAGGYLDGDQVESLL